MRYVLCGLVYTHCYSYERMVVISLSLEFEFVLSLSLSVSVTVTVSVTVSGFGLEFRILAEKQQRDFGKLNKFDLCEGGSF